MNDIETFIREAARIRGIDPDIAIKVAKSEGGITQYAAHGDFDTGDSWWPFQLHYGGAGYEKYGTVAGMGVGFTALTGWQPGDPRAWRDSVRYALNRAKASGWSAWYGAAHVGVGQWDGIDRNHPWAAAAEPWDYETGASPVPKVTYNRNEPAHPQEDSFDCSQESLEWALYALGRKPQEDWLEPTMIAEGVMSPQQGLLDASGAGLADFVRRHYGEFGYDANHEPVVTWEWAVHEGAANGDGSGHGYPVLLGGRKFGAEGHWVGLRDYDPKQRLLLLANPSDGYDGIRQALNETQFRTRGPWSAVRVWHPDLLEPVPPPPPSPTPIDWAAELRAILAADDREHGERLRAKILALLERTS